MKTAWAFDPKWTDAEAEVWYRMRNLTPETPTIEKIKGLALLAPILAKMSHMEVAALLENLRERLKLRAGDLVELKADIKVARKAQEAKSKKSGVPPT